MPALELEQVSELAAESWFKAVKQWHKINGAQVAVVAPSPSSGATTTPACELIGIAKSTLPAAAMVVPDGASARPAGE
jgi:hypothetical protein